MISTFDEYASGLLEQAKRFLERAKDEKSAEGKNSYLNASLLIAYCSLEAIVNGVIEEFKERKELFSTHELALLLEKGVRLKSGRFVVTEQLQISRLNEKIELLFDKFRCKSAYSKSRWWADFNQGSRIRNAITHPKKLNELNYDLVKNTILSIIECIDLIFKTIYKKGFPVKYKGLTSQYSF